MKLRNNFLFLTIFVFLIMISSGIVFAEDSALPSVATGEVSGDIEIASENPFAAGVTDGELAYEIPENQDNDCADAHCGDFCRGGGKCSGGEFRRGAAESPAG